MLIVDLDFHTFLLKKVIHNFKPTVSAILRSNVLQLILHTAKFLAYVSLIDFFHCSSYHYFQLS